MNQPIDKNGEDNDSSNESASSSTILRYQDDIEVFRAVNQDIGFGYFTEFDSTFETSFGFQTGNFKQIQIDDNFLKKAKLLLQSQQQEPSSQQKIDYLKIPQQPYNFSFGFSKGNGESMMISASKLKQAELLLKTQSQCQDNFLDLLNSNIKSKSKSPTPVLPKKINIVEQKTLESYRKPKSNKLLIIPSSTKQSISSKRINRLIQYQSERPYLKLKLIDLVFNEVDLSQYKQQIQFTHFKQQCTLNHCCLCNNNINHITKEQIIVLCCQKYGNQLQQKFVEWYHQIVFKLFKYQKYYPDIINKRLNAHNIIVELEKKIEKQSTSSQDPVGLLMRKGFCSQGITMNLIIIAIHHVQNKGYYLLELTDGWYSLYSPVRIEISQKSNTKNNYYITKLILKKCIFVGCKIQISSWRQYPVKGILQFLNCPNQLPCIQIMYNSLIKLSNNSKLGITTNLIYKQLQYCRSGCGLIPICYFFIIRMISSRQQQLYLRVGNNRCNYLIKIFGGESLIDEFRQKKYYLFQNLKMISKFQLQSTRITRFEQIRQSSQFDQVLKQILWNTSNSDQIERIYDLILKITHISNTTIYGRYNNFSLVIQMGQPKLKQSNIHINQILLLTQVKLDSNVNNQFLFKNTSLTKLLSDSKFKLYQQIIKSLNVQ